MKRLVLTIIAIVIACAGAQAVEVEIDGIRYDVVTRAKAATVIANEPKYTGDIVIPTSIEYEDIECAVTSIEQYAFYNCTGLTSVTIPSSVTTIEDGAFALCTGLTSVTIPSSVTTIRWSAFYGCTGLTSVTISEGVTAIGGEAFKGCSGLTSVTIPSSVTTIDGGAFGDCTGLISVTIPSSVTYIGNIFWGCTSLTSVIIPSSVTTIEWSTFYGCTGLTSVTIPSSVTIIGGEAFWGCTSLTSMIIPSSVTTIEGEAFAGCKELADVYCYAERVPSTNSDAFEGAYPEASTLHVPASAIEAYRTTEPWSQFGTIVALPGVTYMVDGEFYKVISYQEGEAIVPEPAPTKEGYTFSGWSEIPETMPDHDVIVTGSFTPNTYKLIYMVDGEEYSVEEVEFEAEITPKEEPTKEGYAFSGWSGIPATMPAHDVTVTGTFTFVPFEQCAKPTIGYKNGHLSFKCETEGVTFNSKISDSDVSTYQISDIDLTVTYTINVYATKDGYRDSELATATLCWIDVDPRKEGITEDDEDAVSEVKAVPVLIQSEGNGLTVNGAMAGTPIAVYDLSGRLIATTTASENSTTVSMPINEKVVVVKVGNKAVKVKK